MLGVATSIALGGSCLAVKVPGTRVAPWCMPWWPCDRHLTSKVQATDGLVGLQLPGGQDSSANSGSANRYGTGDGGDRFSLEWNWK